MRVDGGRIAVAAVIVLAILAGGLGGSSEPGSRSHAAGLETNPGPGQRAGAGPSPSPSAEPVQAEPDPGYFSRVPTFDPPPAPERAQFPPGGGAPWVSRIPTTQPVAFITIDDGWVKGPEVLRLLRRAKVPVTLFLTINATKDNPEFFRPLLAAGAVIEAHTITHNELPGRSYENQKHEICGSADTLGQWYGRRPVLFRSPFGTKDATTLRAAHDCGMKAVLFWKETVDKGNVRFQSGSTVQAGDIILMHFRERFVDDFIAALQAIKNAGLTPALLEDYL